MLHNLVRNVSEARTGRSASIAIISGIVEEKDGRWLRLVLLDDGPGFPPEVLQKPFEPYVTSKKHGSGLGLAICRKIVLEHDGRIAIANRPEGGARVTILLPLDARQA
jgi:nitrogen fixation/metabolism regulation signal transduction histidine kinase